MDVISERLISVATMVGICPGCGESTAYVREKIWSDGGIRFYCPHCGRWLGCQLCNDGPECELLQKGN